MRPDLDVPLQLVDASVMATSTASGVPGRRRAPAPPLKPGRSSQSPPPQQLSGGSSDQLRMRFLTADRNYETIKQLARKGERGGVAAVVG